MYGSNDFGTSFLERLSSSRRVFTTNSLLAPHDFSPFLFD